MHIKFLKHGTGSAKKAADYLIQENDYRGEVRAEVSVLRGDPYQVAAVSDSLAFKYKYTSGMIAWAPEDQPADQQIEKVLDDFERTAWAGFDRDRYCWSAVLHREDNGGCHIHIFAARTDLETGKSLNIAPPGHLKTFDALRDYYNHKERWARPDDPERARLYQPGFHTYIDAAKIRAGIEVEPDPRQLVTDFLMQRIESGEIEDRTDIIQSLHDAGLETPRQGKQYITVLDPKTDRKFRLKGAIYNAEFKRSELEESFTGENTERPGRDREHDNRRAFEALKELENRIENRAVYNRKRYQTNGSEHQCVTDRDAAEDRRLCREPEKTDSQKVDRNGTDWPESLRRHLRRELGADAVSVVQYQGQDGTPPRADSTDPGTDQHLKTDRAENMGLKPQRKREREIHHFTLGDNHQPNGLHSGREKSPKVRKEVNHGTDRTGTAIDQTLKNSLSGQSKTIRELNEQVQLLDDRVRALTEAYNSLSAIYSGKKNES